ncbi:hypothetical protein [Candidatus Pelagibacter sp.]|uniref:tetratricopeptide repeat protein n=1 Tax=Candidatus Pelagibacter sp. TaxID=2024849 RepID=UPI003F837E1C
MEEILKKIIDYLNNNQLIEALQLCNKHTEKKIEHLILNIKGVIFFKQNKLELAKENFLKSIDLSKNFIDPYKNLFKIHLKQKDYISAIESGKKVIEYENKKNPLSYFNLALAFDLNEDYKTAIKLYKIVEKTDFKEKKILFNNLAKCYFSDRNINESTHYYHKALEIDKNDKIIINNLLNLYLRIEKIDEVEYYYNRAKEIDENYIEFKLNKSEYLLLKNKTEEAIKLLESIINETKSYIAYPKLAKIYAMINNNKKVIETIDEALKVYPNMRDLKFTRGLLHLAEGEYEKGWDLYELRPSIQKRKFFENIKLWRGENLKNSSILVTSEQGMGDVLQFSKFLINLSPLCKKIDFLVYSKLLPLFKKNYKNINICEVSEIQNRKYDYRISIGSLNKYFYKDVKSDTSELINFDNDKKNEWESILSKKKRNIGLIWSGNFFGPKEPYRSIELKNFQKLLKLDLNFYSFQNEIWDRDKNFFQNSNIVDYSQKSFSDIIAIIQNLDLVISTDTLFLHLSCIINKETWGLISFNADWRWYDYYNYNPYKSLKIYKQSENRNWDGVIDLIYSNIKNKFLI